MRTTLRRIGNSRGVLIPASFLAACELEDELELRLDGDRIVIERVRAPRTGWFDGYRPDSDEDVWPESMDAEEDAEWQW